MQTIEQLKPVSQFEPIFTKCITLNKYNCVTSVRRYLTSLYVFPSNNSDYVKIICQAPKSTEVI